MRQIEIPLWAKLDKYDQEYLIGSLGEDDLQVNINLNDVTFIIFDPSEDNDGNITAPGKLIIRSKGT